MFFCCKCTVITLIFSNFSFFSVIFSNVFSNKQMSVHAQHLSHYSLCILSLSLSDVCNSTDLPEVEIISLLEEQLPHYKLRADTIYGYDHDDWLHTPLISPDVNLDLTTEQIEETLKYFRKHKIIHSRFVPLLLSLSFTVCHSWWSCIFLWPFFT